MENAGDSDVTIPNEDLLSRLTELKREKSEMADSLEQLLQYIAELEERLQQEANRTKGTHICKECSARSTSTIEFEKGKDGDEESEEGNLVNRRKKDRRVNGGTGSIKKEAEADIFFDGRPSEKTNVGIEASGRGRQLEQMRREKEGLCEKLVEMTMYANNLLSYNAELERIVHSYAVLSHLSCSTLYREDESKNFDSSLISYDTDEKEEDCETSFHALQRKVWPRVHQMKGSRMKPDIGLAGDSVLFTELIDD